MHSPTITTHDADTISEHSVTARAVEVRHAIQAAAREAGRQQLRLAALLFEVHEHEYFKEWGFNSFRKFVDRECGFGIRKAQLFIDFHRKFVVELEIPSTELESLGWSKLALVSSVIQPDNQKELLTAIQELSYRELKRLVNELRKRDTSPLSTTEWPALLGDTDSAFWPNGFIPERAEWLLDRPAEHEFYVQEDVWEQLCYAIHHGMNVLLTGPSGAGKSEVCSLISDAADRKIERFNFGAMTEPRVSLIGNVHFDPESGTRFVKSRFVNAFQREGTVLLLDELSRAGRDAFNILLPLLDGQEYLALDEHDQAPVMHRAKGVCFLATANLGMEYTGADALDVALRDRFPIQIVIDFPPMQKEMEILLHRCFGLNTGHASRLVKLATRQREMASEGEFVGMVSTRALLAAGHQLASGVSMANAFHFCILNRFSSDGGDTSDRARLRQIFQKDESF